MSCRQVYNLGSPSLGNVTKLPSKNHVVMNDVLSAHSVGESVDGLGELAVPRATENVVQQPANVIMPTPLAMNSVGHGSMHGENLVSYKDSLAEFLSRPVLIRQLQTGTGYSDSCHPWELYMANPLVAEKLKAFGFLRGTLHLRFVMSVSQFVQGRVYVAYNPGGNQDDVAYDRGNQIITMSHLPYSGYMDPGIANDMEWSIPFHELYPFRSATTAALGNEFGGTLLTRVSIPFENASTGTPTGTIIKVLAWMTDVELVVAAIPQSQTTSHASRALQLATTGLSAVKALTGVTSASAMVHRVGDALAAFGYTREADPRDLNPTRLRSTSAWAITEGAEQSYPLTADPFAEKTLATDYVTGFSQDELVVASMAGRYSMATSFTWTSTSLPHIFSIYVHPSSLANTCVDAVSLPFSYWRGSMRYKLSAVRTPFHKGKLLVKWAPHAIVIDDTLNTGYSVIWDLDSTPEIELIIPYNRADYWAQIPVHNVVVDSTMANGSLCVYVLEGLTGPADSVSVPIHVFVAGGEDIAFTCPTFQNMRLVTFGDHDISGSWVPATAPDAPFPPKISPQILRDPAFPQAGYEDRSLPKALTYGDDVVFAFPQAGYEDRSLTENVFRLGPPSSSTDAALRSMGEEILSFRELLKRKSRAYRIIPETNQVLFFPTYPKSPRAALGWIDASSTAFMASPADPTLMAYLMAMFLGVRGSTKWDFVSPGATATYNIVRGFGHLGVNYFDSSTGLYNGSMTGAAYSRTDLDGVASVVVPQYIRGHYTRAASYLSDQVLSGTTFLSPEFQDIKDNGVFLRPSGIQGVEAFVAAGDDFNLIYYLGPPMFRTFI